MDDLKLYISNIEDIKRPTLEFICTKDESGSTWRAYKCLENSKFYFTMINKESIIHSEASPELVEELKK